MSATPFDLTAGLGKIHAARGAATKPLERLAAEVEFATALARATPEHQDEWLGLIAQAVAEVETALAADDPAALPAAAQRAEETMAPIGPYAKGFTIHCCGHGHIDMNWMWSWPETVSVCHDTFRTVDRLMDEYPEFHYSQSQVSVYEAMRTHHPEVLDRIKARVREGRWEITASQWVEGDKNLASGEILARHLLYSRRWLAEQFELPYDAVKIDWECDTFGHAWTHPGLLAHGGVSRYYFHRAGCRKRLFWWEGKDGSRVLAYDDYCVGYNCEIAPYMAQHLVRFYEETQLRDMMWVYGVGDHGGGPTRRHLDAARDMSTWPIWPTIRLTTTDAYYSLIEPQAGHLPVVKDELNFVFRGCYTAQSAIKRANRLCETNLVESEAFAVLAGALAGTEYPRTRLQGAWEKAMFLQFHDILPGSGTRETRDYCMGITQEALSQTQAIRTAALRALAERIDTASLVEPRRGADLGAGAGLGAAWGGISARGAGAGPGGVFLMANPTALERSEVVRARIWDHELPDHTIAVTAEDGAAVRAQVLQRGHYWGHNFTEIAFPVEKVAGLGYRTYAVTQKEGLAAGEGASARFPKAELTGELEGPVVLENEYLRLSVAPGSGAVIGLYDKKAERQLLPEGKQLGVLVYQREAPHGMTSWSIGQVVEEELLTEGASLRVEAPGPHLAAVRSTRTYRGCHLSLIIALSAGSPRIDFRLEYDWRDFGGPSEGVPVLKVAFPLEIPQASATFEIPCGFIERPANGDEVPALRWADLSGPEGGAALLNRGKYGHTVTPEEIRLTILRASYDPDPLPEVGQGEAEFGLLIHGPEVGPAEITHAATLAAHPLTPFGTDIHGGDLPTAAEGLTIVSPNVALSGLKRAEDSDALVLRVYEIEGKETEARIRIAPQLAAAGCPAVEVNAMEEPTAKNTAHWDGQELRVKLPAFGVTAIRLG